MHCSATAAFAVSSLPLPRPSSLSSLFLLSSPFPQSAAFHEAKKKLRALRAKAEAQVDGQ